ncbi:MAG: sigma-54-dependent Fis family transcriptional regulator [Polyangiaceae bacterium]
MSVSASDATATLSREVLGFELVVTRDGATFTLPLPEHGELRIGRAEDDDVRLAGNSVSRHHALLRVRATAITVEDLGSSNGTLLRGRRALPNTELPLQVGDSLLIGEFVVTLRERRAPTEPPLGVTRPSEDGAFVRRSPAMELLFRNTDPVARSKINVLILGETGVGKDVLARSIHDRSERCDRPFLRLNCAALAEPLLESELFGHERGAFTGASQAEPGLLLSASTGTVFLDEIGELPPRLQPKLLQVIETQEILSVGSVRPRPIDVRFIAATNRALAQDVAESAFAVTSSTASRATPRRSRPCASALKTSFRWRKSSCGARRGRSAGHGSV